MLQASPKGFLLKREKLTNVEFAFEHILNGKFRPDGDWLLYIINRNRSRQPTARDFRTHPNSFNRLI